jgi:hypothetical protein
MTAKHDVLTVGGALTPEHDVYLAVVVTVMFLAGCVIAVVDRYRRTRERKGWE